MLRGHQLWFVWSVARHQMHAIQVLDRRFWQQRHIRSPCRLFRHIHNHALTGCFRTRGKIAPSRRLLLVGTLTTSPYPHFNPFCPLMCSLTPLSSRGRDIELLVNQLSGVLTEGLITAYGEETGPITSKNTSNNFQNSHQWQRRPTFELFQASQPCFVTASRWELSLISATHPPLEKQERHVIRLINLSAKTHSCLFS